MAAITIAHAPDGRHAVLNEDGNVLGLHNSLASAQRQMSDYMAPGGGAQGQAQAQQRQQQQQAPGTTMYPGGQIPPTMTPGGGMGGAPPMQGGGQVMTPGGGAGGAPPMQGGQMMTPGGGATPAPPGGPHYQMDNGVSPGVAQPNPISQFHQTFGMPTPEQQAQQSAVQAHMAQQHAAQVALVNRLAAPGQPMAPGVGAPQLQAAWNAFHPQQQSGGSAQLGRY